MNILPLALTAKNNCYLIHRMPTIPLLEVLGVRLGVFIEIVSKQPLKGPIVVRVGNREIAIDRDIAQNIIVKEVVE